MKAGLLIGVLLGLVVAGLLFFSAYKTYQASRQICANGRADCVRPGG